MRAILIAALTVLATSLVTSSMAQPAASARVAERADCASRIQTLDASQAEGAERLAEKNDAVELCDSQYKRDKTVQRLVNECAKYMEQPVIKQLLVTECQISAFKYANALRFLKAEYQK